MRHTPSHHRYGTRVRGERAHNIFGVEFTVQDRHREHKQSSRSTGAAAVLASKGGSYGSKTDDETPIPGPYVPSVPSSNLRGFLSHSGHELAHPCLCRDVLCRSYHWGEHKQWHECQHTMEKSSRHTHSK